VGPRRLVLRGAGKAHPRHPLQGIEVLSGEADYQRSSAEVVGAAWSGRDQQKRLVFTSNGCIFARTGKQDDKLADFTGESPESQPAPDWATRPLPRLTSARVRPR
jgi:hypothetical protein